MVRQHRTRRSIIRAVGAVGAAGVSGPVPPAIASDGSGVDIVHVPDDRSTIQGGVDAADEGALVLVEAGTYAETVEVSTPGITVRGTDRNEVVLDGEFERTYGIDVEADGVALENLTARHFTGNAFYWSSVEGFRGSFLTAYNNGNYGIYAYRARDGRFEHSYASGHPDAGFYLGRNDPFEAVISNVVAERNAMGYSGTSAGGDLTIRDSVWRDNAAGIVPNTLDDRDPPQRSCRIVENLVYGNANADAPNKELTYPAFGSGILVWGGSENLIADNEVRDHEHFGIVVEHNVVEPAENVIRGNRVSESGTADLALGEPAGEGNRFADNEFSTSLPLAIEAASSEREGEGEVEGSERVSDGFAERERVAERGEFPAGNWRDQPAPGDRPTMPDPEAPPRSAEKSSSWEGEG